MTISNVTKQQEYALDALEFLRSDPFLEIALTVDEFNALYEQSEVRGTGPKYGIVIQQSMDKLFVREIIRAADITHKDFYRDQLTQTIRTIGAHRFITEMLEPDSLDSDLVVYSKARLDKAMDKVEEWATRTRKIPVPTPKKTKTKQTTPVVSELNHPLEAVSAMREMRHLADSVKISVHPFNEEKVIKSCVMNDGKIDYKMVAAKLRHNHTNYDVLRISRKIRRNTYWKLTAQPAIRIAVCEKLLLMTENPELHFRLMQEIELANAEFQKKLSTAATEPNFTASVDDMFIKTLKRRVINKNKFNFMRCLETI